MRSIWFFSGGICEAGLLLMPAPISMMLEHLGKAERLNLPRRQSRCDRYTAEINFIPAEKNPLRFVLALACPSVEQIWNIWMTPRTIGVSTKVCWDSGRELRN
jgi:hypothetical protein